MQIIAGIHRGKKLFCRQSSTLRPTSSRMRGAVFNMCQLSIQEASFLDLYAGVGAMGLEALSRGAAQSIFVDNDRSSIHLIKKNSIHLNEEKRSTVLRMNAIDALKWFEERQMQFDIIYVDPPYGVETFLSNQVLKIIDASSLLKKEGELFLEDDINAENEKFCLHNLELKSRRSVGRTLLRHFTINHLQCRPCTELE